MTKLRLPLFSLSFVALLACSGDGQYRDGVTYHTTLTQYATCNALEADLKQMLKAEVDTHFDQVGRWDLAGGFQDDGNADPSSADGDGRQEGEDYSGTNNQENGVDEADFVKTDGYHVYVLNGNRLHIYGTPEFGDLVPESVTHIEGEPSQMLINRDAAKAVVFSRVWADSLPADHPLRKLLGREVDSGWMWRSGIVTKITVLDISDRTNPELQRELFLEGWYQTARMVDASVRVGAYSWLYIPGLYDWWWYYGDGSNVALAKLRAKARIDATPLTELVPQMHERSPNGEFRTHGLSNSACREFYRPTNSHGRGISSIISLDLFGAGLSFDADHVVTNWPTLYSSQDYMYIAEPTNDWWWFWWNEDVPEQLNVHMFDIKTPGNTRYMGSGRVDGTLHNQFSLDEQDGYLRVATTTNMWNRWWLEDPPEADNHVYVMDLVNRKLQTVGHVDGIAGGERIFAARMDGDRGYLVTFLQIDPLWTLDLSDPRNPRVVGELEVPGFSTYIHPIADDKLLSIGVGGDENGANWRTQISMFDVSDFANPAMFDVEELVTEGEWGWSEAMYEHKAFQYWAPKELLAVPMSSYDWDYNNYRYHSRLELLTVDLESGLSHYGSIDHSFLFNNDPEQWWYFRDVRRSIFMGDFIYAISDRGVTVHKLAPSLDMVTAQELPGYSPSDWWWWW